MTKKRLKNAKNEKFTKESKMAKTKELKLLRGQIRQICQEMLPSILTEELIRHGLAKLDAELKRRLNEIDNRQKDLRDYLVRNSINNAQLK
jgi:hypothetical protein